MRGGWGGWDEISERKPQAQEEEETMTHAASNLDELGPAWRELQKTAPVKLQAIRLAGGINPPRYGAVHSTMHV